jgi:hypothetical protein
MVLEEAIQPPEVKQCYGGRLPHAVAGDSWRLGEFTALPLSPPSSLSTRRVRGELAQ